MRPNVAFVVGTPATTGGTEWLARVSGREDVDRFDRRPVDGGDVAEVGHVRVVVGQHLGGGRVVVGDPCEVEPPSGEAEAHFGTGVPGTQ
jgi:hypothetical protein